METLQLILFLMVAVVVSGLIDPLLRGVSLPIVQIIVGAVIAFVLPTSLGEGIDPELLFILLVAPLHFNESRHADSAALWRNRWGIGSLVTGCVLVTMVVVGFSLHALVPAIPLAAALAMGAAMGSTDAMAVTALTKDVRFGKRHESLLMGEVLFNDVTGTVGFQCAIAVVVSGAFSLTYAGEHFALDLFGGMLAGAVLGLVFWAVMAAVRKAGLDNPTVHVLLELIAPFFIYLACEQLHVGGLIGVVVGGMVISLLPQRKNVALARQRMQSQSVWKTIEFVLNGVVFVVLGMQLPGVLSPAVSGNIVGPALLVVAVAVVTLALEFSRFVYILGMDVVDAKSNGRSAHACFSAAGIRSALGMAFAGAKGGVTLSLMLTVPLTLAGGEAFPLRSELISLASGVILCTLLLANFAVPALLPHKSREKRTKSYVDAEIVLLERVIAAIQEDAHLTGSVRELEGEAADEERLRVLESDGEGGVDLPRQAADGSFEILDDVDEPATAIVLKQYGDRIKEMVPHASPEVAARARALTLRIDELYDQADALDHALKDAEEDEDGLPISLTAHMKALRAVGDAVDDIRDQALARELEFIKEMKRAGELSLGHARALRDDVYIQRLAR